MTFVGDPIQAEVPLNHHAPDRPRVAVVVIGRNESAHLHACLESIQAIDYPQSQVETIYVDSASTDNSPQLAASFGARVIPVSGDPMTAARGRNAGWTATQAPYILFLDGDTQVHPQFVELALAALDQEPTIAAVWGHRRESAPQASIYNRVLDLDWIYPAGWTEFFGGDVLIRREALASVNGYNPELIAGEEPEMCRRLRAHQLDNGNPWKILHVDAPMTQHDLRIAHFSQYWKRAIRAGHAYEQVSGLFRNTSDPFWTAEARRNQNRALFWIGLTVVALLASLVLRSALPVIFPLGLIVLAACRSAWKVRDRSNSWSTLLLFGLHSHLQAIPIYLGQLRYRSAKARKQKVTLIEYKRT